MGIISGLAKILIDISVRIAKTIMKGVRLWQSKQKNY